MGAQIYLVPTSGTYEGKLLVFDTVESMSITAVSKIPQHPVESLNRSSADHRFRDGTKIQITGAISDSWETDIKEDPTPVFQTAANKSQKVLRNKIVVEYDEQQLVNKVVNQILDKQEPDQDELSLALNIDSYWITLARRTVALEKDDLERARDKQLSLEGVISNNFTNGTRINTVLQAKEMLERMDEESTIMTVFTMNDGQYENMVLTNFTNIARNGEQRGAYWVSLSLEQQLLATTAKNKIVIDEANTEAASDNINKGKKTRTVVDRSDVNYKKLLIIWDKEIAIADNLNRQADFRKLGDTVTKGVKAKDRILDAVYIKYLHAGADQKVALAEARKDVIAAIQLLAG